MEAKQGSKVEVEYTGTLENGEIFDSNAGKEPLKFELGAHQVIKGFEDAIIGMNEGDEKDITLSPEHAYGEPKKELEREIPKEIVKADKIKVGDTLGLKTQQGQVIPAKILEISDDKIKVDLNHPLSGKTLKFKIKVLKIQ